MCLLLLIINTNNIILYNLYIFFLFEYLIITIPHLLFVAYNPGHHNLLGKGGVARIIFNKRIVQV